MNSRILLVDDDRFLLENLSRLIRNEGYEVVAAASAAEAHDALKTAEVHLAIFDVGLPDYDGFTLCREVRKLHRFPIIMLTAQGESTQKVIGLESGADDYLTKPFDPVELIARIRAQFRRAGEYTAGPTILKVGNITVNPATREAWVNETKLDLTNKEFALLHHLASKAGSVVSREDLFNQSWGFDISFGSNSLDVYIYRLRKKLESFPDQPRCLFTLKGYGYKLENRS